MNACRKRSHLFSRRTSRLISLRWWDTGSGPETTATTLYEYDSFGNVVKQTLTLSDNPTPQNSPITEMTHSVESTDEGVFSVTTNTRYNAEGNPLVSTQKSLISHLSNAVESKNLTIDERNLTSTQWVEYHVGTKRKTYNSLPTRNITAEAELLYEIIFEYFIYNYTSLFICKSKF